MHHLILILLLATTSPAWAVTKYVTQSGTCTSGSTTYDPATDTCGSGSATVYKTIRSGADNVGASNTLLMRGGTYSELCTVALIESGTALAPTIIAPYPGETVTWIKDPAGDARDCLISFSSRSFIEIRGNRNPNYASTYGTLIMDGNNDTGATDQYIITAANDATDLTITGIELRNGNESCITTATVRLTVTWNEIHHCGLANSYLWHAIYYSGADSIISHNTFHDIYGYAVHCYSSSAKCNTGTITWNLLYDVGLATNAQSGGILVNGDGNLIERNSIQCILSTSDFGITTYPGSTNTIILHNSITGCGTALFLQASSSGHLVKNNIAYGNGTNINNASSGSTLANNLTSNPSFRNTTTHDLSLLAGSAAIDAGVDVGRVYNGSNPDQGAFETITFQSCEVPSGAGSTIQITFNNNVSPPLSSTVTTFTARKSGASNGVVSSSRIGDNIAGLTLTNPYVGGDTADISWSSGGLTDSSLLGGTVNQPYIQTLTNQSCTNNVGGTSYVLSQAAFLYYGVHGPENTTDVRTGENVLLYQTIQGGALRVRFAITCAVSNCPSTGFLLYYSTDGVTYASVPSVFGVGNVATCDGYYNSIGVTQGQPTTNRLSTSGTFVPGGIITTASAVPTINGLNATYKTEMEYCVAFNTTANADYRFRLYEQSGATLSTYTNTPTVRIVPPRASAF